MIGGYAEAAPFIADEGWTYTPEDDEGWTIAPEEPTILDQGWYEDTTIL